MILRLFILLSLLLASPASAQLFLLQSNSQISSGSGLPPGTPFTALNTYFLAPTTASPAGNDSNPGTLAAPWASPNHALNCGDVIIAAAGTYTQAFGSWGTVSNCPSTSAGIDGTGGIYFANLVCGASDVASCIFNNSSGAKTFGVNADNWAVQGFECTGGGNNLCYNMSAIATSTTQLHHIAFINDLAINSSQGYQEDDNVGGGDPGENTNVPGNGADYFAYIGDICANCGQSGFGVAGFNVVFPSQYDSLSGTHILVDGNFAWNITTASSDDGEDYMVDTPDKHGYAATIVQSNNIGFAAARYCMAYTLDNYNTSYSANIKGYNNTCYGDGAGVPNTNAEPVAEYMLLAMADSLTRPVMAFSNNLAQTDSDIAYFTGSSQFVYSLGLTSAGSAGTTAGTYNNIALTNVSGSGTGATANIVVANVSGVIEVTSVTLNAHGTGYASGNVLSAASGSIGGVTGFTTTVSTPVQLVALYEGYSGTFTNLTMTGNWWDAISTTCTSGAGTCYPSSAPYSAQFYPSNTHSASDTFGTAPGYTNVSDLITNRLGNPSCAGFQTTVACLGYNPVTQTLTTPSIISDLTPTASGTSGKGYQLPSTTCTPNSDWPTWLKGEVYLHWNGAGLTQNFGLVTQPCNIIAVAPTNLTLPEITGGTDVPGQTLSVALGTWANSPTSYTYSWHYIGGASLSTATTYALTSADLTNRLQVDVTATNTAGSTTVTTDFIGPVESSLPPAPTCGESPLAQCNTPALYSSLPTYLANFLQNGHAIYPGCNIPPAAPTSSSAHVWYFDGVTGNQSNTGHAGSPLKDPNSIFASSSGLGPLFPGTIHPGDVVYVKGGQTYSPAINWNLASRYSNSTAAPGGTPEWTWIMADPASSSNPVALSLNITSSSDFIFSGINVEENALDQGTYDQQGTAISAAGNAASPLYDIIFESGAVDSWHGHSNDPWLPSAYPSANGHSDGTVQTISPYMGGGANPATFDISASGAGQTQLFLTNGVPVFNPGAIPATYVSSPGYYFQWQNPAGGAPPSNTGIPNGTKIKDINGNASTIFEGYFSLGSGVQPTATPVLNEAYFNTSTLHMWISNATPAWVDEGLGYITIEGCDPTADAATGCPPSGAPNSPPNGTNLVGCDPLIAGVSGGCAGSGAPGWSSAPVWNGTTRALSTELADFQPYLVQAPAGAWNHVDQDYTLNGFTFNGVGGNNNVDPTNVNDVTGSSCISVKDYIIRNSFNSFTFGLTQNSLVYNTRIKYRTGDAIDIYGSHRTWIINSYTSDATFERTHPDVVQFAINGGWGTESSVYYGNGVVNTEGYTATDPTDPFPNFTMSVESTDGIYSATYLADNIMFGSSNPMSLGGQYNVAVQNDSFFDLSSSGRIQLDSGAKALEHLPSNTLVGNNLTNAIERDNGVTGASTSCTADLSTVLGNVQIPFINYSTSTPTVANATICTSPSLSSGVTNGTYTGVYADVNSWDAEETRTEASVTSPFTEFHPLTPTGTGLILGVALSPCLQNNVPTGTGCPTSGSPGIMNLRPNSSFTPTPITGILGQVLTVFGIPQSGLIGDTYVLASTSYCGVGVGICGTTSDFADAYAPAGLYQRCATPSTSVPPCTSASKSLSTTFAGYGGTPASSGPVTFGNLRFTPAIIAGGSTSLGAQAPPANHDRKAWSNPPNVGAY